MPWLLMCRHELWLWNLKHFLDGEQVWSPFVRLVFPQLILLTKLQSWISRRLKKGIWHFECCQALNAPHLVGNAISNSSSLAFDKGLVV